MSTPNRPAPLQTSYPIDPENVHEMNRLTNQARLMTETTGLLPPQVSLMAGQTVLDIGCGPGEWVLAVAHQYPDCQVIGLDISQRLRTGTAPPQCPLRGCERLRTTAFPRYLLRLDPRALRHRLFVHYHLAG